MTNQYSEDYENLKKISAYLDKRVVGQPRAVKEIEKAFFKVLAGLNGGNRPLGVYFFAGPSRTGKTMTALALSEALYPLRRKYTVKLKAEENRKEMENLDKLLKFIEKDKSKNSAEINARAEEARKMYSAIKDNIQRQTRMLETMSDEEFNRNLPGLVRIDCGMLGFHEASVSSLTSSSPGFVGSNRPGLLDPNVINNNWGCVVLFDEIEKAHPAIYNVLLQIFDSGKLTLVNAQGAVDFTNAIIILTSNIGGAMMEKESKGGGKIGYKLNRAADLNSEDVKMKSEAAYEICKEEYKNKFSREFRNRIDRLVTFNYLDAESLKKILKLELEKVSELVKNGKPFSFQCEDSAVEVLFKKLDHFEEQAAEIVHLIEREVKAPLSELIVKGIAKDGDVLRLADDGKGGLKFRVLRKK